MKHMVYMIDMEDTNMNIGIKQEILERIESFNLPKASGLFESGYIPVWDTETGIIRKDDGFLSDKIKAVRWVYRKWPFMVLKVREDETGVYYLFLCVDIDPDCWLNERDESYIKNNSFQFNGPAFFPKTKRFSSNELIGGVVFPNHALHVDASSAAFKDYHKSPPKDVYTKGKGV